MVFGVEDTVKMDGECMLRKPTCNGFSSSIEEHSKPTCNGGSSGTSVRDGGIMTYKRRKSMDNGTSAQRSEESPLSQKFISKTIDQCDGQVTNGNHDIARNRPILLDSEDSSLQSNWRKVLERMLSSAVSSDIEGCVRTALTSGIFPVTQGFNRQAFSEQTSQTKDAVTSDQEHFNGEGRNPCQVPRETKKSWSPARRNGSRSKLNDQANCNGSGLNAERCQNVLVDVITSEKFALLCNLLLGDLPDFAVSAFHLIDMNMNNKVYEKSPQSFASDLQQVWEKCRKKGQQMISLADGLSDVSQASYIKQVGKLPQEVQVYEKREINGHCGGQLVPRTKPEAHLLCKDCICKQCGSAADSDNILICDGCEEMYHFSCIEPPLRDIPKQSWYCGICSSKGKLSPQHDSVENGAEDPCGGGDEENVHHGCVVCEKLRELQIQRSAIENSRVTSAAMLPYRHESSYFHTNAETHAGETSMEEESGNSGLLCKVCRVGIDDKREFVECANTHCLSKFYHVSCLKSQPQVISGGWYCPSCLCRACLEDKDDDDIVLCDGCDDGYHIFCMEPPQSTIPKGKWYCKFCEKKRSSAGVKNRDKFKSSRSNSEEKSSGRRKNK